jgi:hypothetical protein
MGDRSGDPQQKYFSDRITNDIITGPLKVAEAVRDRPRLDLSIYRKFGKRCRA